MEVSKTAYTKYTSYYDETSLMKGEHANTKGKQQLLLSTDKHRNVIGWFAMT